MLWTMVLEDGRGTTVIAQTEADSVIDAIVNFNHQPEVVDLSVHFNVRTKGDNGEYGYDEPAQVAGIEGVWCITTLTKFDKIAFGKYPSGFPALTADGGC